MNILSSFGTGVARSLTIRFIADTAKASRNIDSLTSKIVRARALSTGSNLPGRTLGAGGGGMSGAVIRGMTSDFGAMGAAGARAFTGIGTAALATLGIVATFGFTMHKAFKFGNLVEGALMQLEVITGSAEKARNIMQKAIRYSMITPFKPGETFNATAMAAQFGIEPFETGKYGLGKNQHFMHIAAGLASYKNAQGEMLGLNRAVYGILAGDRRLLRPVMGLVQPAYEKAKAAGPVGSRAYREKFIEGLGKVPQIMMMAEKYSNTMVGMWSTIVGYGEEFWINFSGAGRKEGVITLWSQVKSILKEIRDYGVAFSDYLSTGATEFGATMGTAFRTMWDTVKAFGPYLIGVFKIAWEMARALWTTIRFVLDTISKVFNFASSLMKIFGVTGSSFEKIISNIQEFITGLQITFMFVGIFIQGTFDMIAQKLDWLGLKLKEFMSKYGGVIDIITTMGLSEAVEKAKSTEFAKTKKGTDIIKFTENALPTIGNVKKNIDFVAGGVNKAAELTGAGLKAGIGSITQIFYETTPQDVRDAKNLSGKKSVPIR